MTPHQETKPRHWASWVPSPVLIASLICGTLLVASIINSQYVSPSNKCSKFAAIKLAGSNSQAAEDSEAVGLQLGHTATNDTGYANITEHPSCAFLRSNEKQHSAPPGLSELKWGAASNVCMDDSAIKWLHRSKSNCYSCIYPHRNVCNGQQQLLYHMSLNYLHPKLPEANLLSIQAFLMTQDLTKSRLILWALEPDKVYTNKSAWLFDTYSDYVTVQHFDYATEVKGTLWEGDGFFGNASLLKEQIPNAACYSDVMRMLILHKYGGLWMDTDVIFYQDVTHLMLTSYQFFMRWTNNHILRMEAGSALTHRMLQTATMMPLNHPKFQEEIVEKLCKPVGYYQIAADTYKFMDIYNGCLLRLLLRQNNTGSPDSRMYDLPLGWWDHDWPGCFTSRDAINDTEWRKVASTYLAMHNRYPGDTNLGPQSSPLQRVIRIIRGFFKACNHVECLPLHGVPLLAYDGLYEKPPEAQHRRLMMQLQQRSVGHL